jgi:serine phosphatase RsbU (regulator of sigma subunit)
VTDEDQRAVDRTVRFIARPAAAKAGELRSFLVVREGCDRGARLELTNERALVGRGPAAALRLADPGVSSMHCAVWIDGDAAWIEDLGSSNGTSVDDRPIAAPTKLGVGSVVALGKTLLRHEKRNVEELEREQALDADLTRAAGYVAAILPPPIANGPVRVAWRYLPTARLGGDAFGYRWLDTNRFALYLVDVSGHGVEAALHAVSVLGALRSGRFADADPLAPAEVLAALNRSYPMASHGGLYFTAWYGVFDRSDRRLCFASAGHPAPLLCSDEAGSTPERCVCRNPPIGLADGVRYAAMERNVAPRSTLYLFSDGIFEIESDEGETWSYDRLAEIVARPRIAAIAEPARIEADVRAALPGRSFDDDVSLLVVDFD